MKFKNELAQAVDGLSGVFLRAFQETQKLAREIESGESPTGDASRVYTIMTNVFMNARFDVIYSRGIRITQKTADDDWQMTIRKMSIDERCIHFDDCAPGSAGCSGVNNCPDGERR